MTLSVEIEHGLGRFALDVRFAIDRPGVTALFGASGCGKSTTIAAIAGLLRPRRGRIAINGDVLLDTERRIAVPARQRRIGTMFQDARLFPHLSVRANLLFGWRRAPAPVSRGEVDRLIDLLGLAPLLDRRPATLSGGERQRIALGRALLCGPRALLLDEPLASLDAARKQEILPHLERLRDEKALPIVYVSHAIDEVVRLADALVLMEDGRSVAAGPLADVLSRPELRALTGGLDFGAVLEATVAGHDAPFRLTVLHTAGGALHVPQVDAPPGSPVRVRIRARDVAVALHPPEESSVLNVLSGRVAEVRQDDGADAVVRIDLGDAFLLAAVTRLSVHRLGLAAGRPVHALVKAVSLDRDSAALARPGVRAPDAPAA